MVFGGLHWGPAPTDSACPLQNWLSGLVPAPHFTEEETEAAQLVEQGLEAAF